MSWSRNIRKFTLSKEQNICSDQ